MFFTYKVACDASSAGTAGNLHRIRAITIAVGATEAVRRRCTVESERVAQFHFVDGEYEHNPGGEESPQGGRL